MKYLQSIEVFSINEKTKYGSTGDKKPSLVGRFASFLGGQIVKGWKKVKLKDLSIQWTQEYVKSIENVLQDRVSDIVIDDVPGKATRQSRKNNTTSNNNGKSDNSNVTQDDATFYDELYNHYKNFEILSVTNDLIIKMVDLIKSAHNNSDYKDVNLHLEHLKKLDIKSYAKNISKLGYSQKLNEFLTKVTGLNNIDISTKNDFDSSKLDALSKDLEKSLNTIADKGDEYEGKIKSKIKSLNDKVKALDEKLYTETDTNKEKVLKDEQDGYKQMIYSLTDLAKWLSLQVSEAAGDNQKGNIGQIIKKIKDLGAKLGVFSGGSGSFDGVLDSVHDKINDIEVTDDERKQISDGINIKRLKIIQFSAENIFNANTGNTDDTEFNLKNYWEKLLLEIDDKFQKVVNVDEVRAQVKTAKIDPKTKANLDIENEIINDTENSGISFVTNNYKKVVADTPFILGVKSSKNEIGYLVLKKVNSNGNWFMLLNMYNKDKEISKDFLGKGIYELFLKNDIPVYLNLDVKTGRNRYVSLLYNYTNGMLYNKTKTGYKFSEVKSQFDKLGVNSKRKYFNLSYKEVKPDVNKRIFNIVLSGTADKAKIEEIYKLNVNKYKVKKVSLSEAAAQHKLMIDYINNLK